MGKEDILIFQGKHGSKKFELEIPRQSLVSELCNEIERETQLPPSCQRIIYNGRTINQTSEDLKKNIGSLGLKSPAKILVLGKKPDEEDPSYKIMKEWGVSCESASTQLNNIEKDLQDMDKGYAPQQLMDQNLPKMIKKIGALSEELMKIMFSLDELSFTVVQKEARAKRKCIIDQIHSLHKKCDELAALAQELKNNHKVV